MTVWHVVPISTTTSEKRRERNARAEKIEFEIIEVLRDLPAPEEVCLKIKGDSS